MRRVTILLTTLLGGCLNLLAQNADSTSLRPTFGVDYTGEVQTDFKRARLANLLELHADISLSRKFSVQLSSISTWSNYNDQILIDLQGFSNIDTYFDIPFALSVAGITWQINDHHSLFAGIRRTDEDYFCSDAFGFFSNSSCGIFPTISWNAPIGVFPNAAMGIHYKYDKENLCLQASVYNGEGNYRFEGRYNVFRICPHSNGIFALGQAEYRHRGSHYFLGASVHTHPKVLPTIWAHAEQALTSKLTLLAAYGHAFASDNLCDDFYGLGGKYSLKRAEFGVFTDYTRILDIDEWATEFIFSYQLTNFLAVKPILHVINTEGETNCVGLLRVEIGI